MWYGQQYSNPAAVWGGAGRYAQYTSQYSLPPLRETPEDLYVVRTSYAQPQQASSNYTGYPFQYQQPAAQPYVFQSPAVQQQAYVSPASSAWPVTGGALTSYPNVQPQQPVYYQAAPSTADYAAYQPSPLQQIMAAYNDDMGPRPYRGSEPYYQQQQQPAYSYNQPQPPAEPRNYYRPEPHPNQWTNQQYSPQYTPYPDNRQSSPPRASSGAPPPIVPVQVYASSSTRNPGTPRWPPPPPSRPQTPRSSPQPRRSSLRQSPRKQEPRDHPILLDYINGSINDAHLVPVFMDAPTGAVPPPVPVAPPPPSVSSVVTRSSTLVRGIRPAVGHAKECAQRYERLQGKQVDPKMAKVQRWLLISKDMDRHKQRDPQGLVEALSIGVPPQLRGLVWQNLVGSDSIARTLNNQRLYSELRSKAASPDTEATIADDARRVYSDVKLFRGDNSPGQSALRCILRAYSLYDEEVGYPVGAAPIIGTLLFHMDEVETFWLFHRVCSKLHLRENFRSNSRLLQRQLYQMQTLLMKFFPALGRHFVILGAVPSMYALPWFIGLFSTTLAPSVVGRVWDLFFYEGWVVVYRVGLALLGMDEERLLTLRTSAEVLEAIRQSHPTKKAADIIAAQRAIPLTSADLLKLNQQASKAKAGK